MTFPSFNWIRGVSDDKRITIVHRLILIRLLVHRQKDGQCSPGYQVVADELGVDRATVFRAVDVAIKRGWIAGFPNHGGRTKRDFVFTFPVDPQQSHSCDGSTVAPKRRLKAPTVAGKRSNSRRKALQQSQAKLEAVEPASEFATNGQRITGKENGQSKSLAPPGVCGGGCQARAEDAELLADQFAEFWSAYPKRVAKEKARDAFARAIERGAHPESLIAGAKRYAVERADEDSKYTKHPSTWLAGGCWEDEPDGDVVVDQNGNVIGIEQSQQPQRSGERGYASIGDELNDELAATGREWF